MTDDKNAEKQHSATSAQAVANYFLHKEKQENRRDMTNLKIQKLVYLAYGFYSVIGKEKLFSNRIEAWKHGPVIPALYYEASRFGSKCIEKEFTECAIIDNENIKTDLGDFKVEPYIPKVENKDIMDVLDYIWDIYSKYTGWTLRNLTHLKGTPWDEVYNNGRGEFKEIPFKKIQEYYKEFINNIINK